MNNIRLALVLWLGIPGWGWAQYSSETAEFLFADPTQVAVTATRSQHPVSETFTTVRVITREELRLAGLRTAQEALERLVPDIEFKEGIVHRFLSVRGAYTSAEFNERVLILLNGMPLNDPGIGNFSLMMLPTEVIERIEIAFGPGSALYGPNAFAGVINIFTRPPEAGSGFESRQFYGGRGDYIASLLYRSGPTRSRFAYGIGIGAWRDWGSDRAINNDARVGFLSLQGHWAPRDGSLWQMHYHFFDMDRGSVGRSTVSSWTPYDRYRPRLHTFSLIRAVESDRFKQQLHLYGLLSTIRFLRESPPGSGVLEPSRYDQSQFGLEYLWQRRSGRTLITFGGEARRLWIEGALIPNTTAWNGASFVQVEWLGGAFRPLLGLRYDHHSAYGSQINPRIGATYRLNRDTVLRTSYGRAFRAPNFTELYIQGFVIWVLTPDGNLLPGKVFGNLELTPEIVRSYEVGLNHTSRRGWQVDLSWFFSDQHELIDVDVLPPDFNDPLTLRAQYRNLSNVEVQGYSVMVSKPLGTHLDFALGYTRMTPRVISAQPTDDFISPYRVVTKLAFHDLKGWNGQLTLYSPARQLTSKEAHEWVAHLSVGYRPSSREEWSLRIDNLFNNAQDIAFIVPGASRTAWLQYIRKW